MSECEEKSAAKEEAKRERAVAKAAKRIEKRKKNFQSGSVCPICGGHDIERHRKGFSWVKVIVLSILTCGLFGIWAILFGFAGSKKIQCTCMDCGETWTV